MGCTQINRNSSFCSSDILFCTYMPSPSSPQLTWVITMQFDPCALSASCICYSWSCSVIFSPRLQLLRNMATQDGSLQSLIAIIFCYCSLQSQALIGKQFSSSIVLFSSILLIASKRNWRLGNEQLLLHLHKTIYCLMHKKSWLRHDSYVFN